jgi:hypothetical protein
MKKILIIIFFITLFSLSAYSDSSNKDSISEKVTDEVERVLSIQLPFNLHKFPENKPIIIKIADFNESDKLFFVLIDYPVGEPVDNKYVYAFKENMGIYNLFKRCKVNSLDKFFNQNVKTLLENKFIEKQIILSKEKAQQKRKLSDEIVIQNQKDLDKLFESVRQYFLMNPELKNVYGNRLLLEITLDTDDLIVDADFVVIKIYSDKNKNGLFGWVYCKDDNKQPLEKFNFSKVSFDDGWTKKNREQSELKIYRLNLDKDVKEQVTP